MFLSQYFQISRGKSPTVAGLMSLPMILGLVVSSIVVGRIITRTGRYKRWMVLGGLSMTAGLALLGTGAVVGLLSGASPLKRALRQLAIGFGAAGATYLLGLLFGASL